MQSLKEYHRNERIKIEKCNILLWNVAFCLALHISADHGKTLVFFIKIVITNYIYHYNAFCTTHIIAVYRGIRHLCHPVQSPDNVL